MKIIFNSSKTAICPEYNFAGALVNAGGVEPRKFKQVSDSVAQDMIKRWGFIIEVNQEEAVRITEQDKKEEIKVEAVEEPRELPIADPSIFPVDKPQKLETQPIEPDTKVDIPNGTDKDGVGWYGDGLSESSLKKVKPAGKGHFMGGALDE